MHFGSEWIIMWQWTLSEQWTKTKANNFRIEYRQFDLGRNWNKYFLIIFFLSMSVWMWVLRENNSINVNEKSTRCTRRSQFEQIRKPNEKRLTIQSGKKKKISKQIHFETIRQSKLGNKKQKLFRNPVCDKSIQLRSKNLKIKGVNIRKSWRKKKWEPSSIAVKKVIILAYDGNSRLLYETKICHRSKITYENANISMFGWNMLKPSKIYDIENHYSE